MRTKLTSGGTVKSLSWFHALVLVQLSHVKKKIIRWCRFKYKKPKMLELSSWAGVSTLLSAIRVCRSMWLATISLLAEQICPVTFKWSLHINLFVCFFVHNPTDIKRPENIISPFSGSLPVQPTRRGSEAHLWAENSWYNQSWMVLVSSRTWGSGWLRLCRVCCVYCLMDWPTLVERSVAIFPVPSFAFVSCCPFSKPDMLAATSQRCRR